MYKNPFPVFQHQSPIFASLLAAKTKAVGLILVEFLAIKEVIARMFNLKISQSLF